MNGLRRRPAATSIAAIAIRLQASTPPLPPDFLAGVAAGVIVTCADADMVVFDVATAVIVTVAGEGIVSGAV